MKYVNIETHKKLLNCVAASAYSYTYEGHEAEICISVDCHC